MKKIRLTKEFHFEMAHLLEGYDGPCRNVHGHSYKLEVTVIGEPISDITNPKFGMVMDFGELKSIVNRLVISRFDHVLLVNNSSEIARKSELHFLEKMERVNYQPTCENLLLHIAELIAPELPPYVKLHHIKLHETATSYAEWYASDNE
ncbi:MAG TPA: 6-carboxytetrahydropterin synthase [Tenuifilaceae bacterium]|nr:6-carboxytetrahydropterin synthase [Tenuifilaceae bacterium]HPE17017.1 6-carboxytetrahydropterin synthase [Tenuifilaceae bacterium]HPJ44698.1 6-carboxytetrahydropterin synthase [Tenuifilaceae bacterium]HPQ32962.1 6-carboxytetrahydropterin synthase [Tenuifilaceae bacterium]HRX66780.1 6-carboxytetrahydropterin synthase [Tenuifilaceae bacterium]